MTEEVTGDTPEKWIARNVFGATDVGGFQPVPANHNIVMETVVNNTVPASLDGAFLAVRSAWMALAVPPMPSELQDADTYVDGDFPGDSAMRYIGVLQAAVRDVAKQSNEHEGVAQLMAEANVRQTKIISRLRDDVMKLQLRLQKAETKNEA